MTDGDGYFPSQRFGTAAPGVKPEEPSLEKAFTGQAPRNGNRVARVKVLAVTGIVIAAVTGYLTGHYMAEPSSPATRRLAVTSTTLPIGTRLTRADVRMVVVQVGPGETEPAGALTPETISGALGLVTRTALLKGIFLQRSFLSSRGVVPGPSQALVGLALKPGQLPSSGLAVGQHVQIVWLRTNLQGAPLPKSLGATTIWDERGPDSSGTAEATVLVPASLATRLAAYAARGAVALVAIAASGH